MPIVPLVQIKHFLFGMQCTIAQIKQLGIIDICGALVGGALVSAIAFF
jgi:hypothetical protein